jgi:hypothetical protein
MCTSTWTRSETTLRLLELVEELSDLFDEPAPVKFDFEAKSRGQATILEPEPDFFQRQEGRVALTNPTTGDCQTFASVNEAARKCKKLLQRSIQNEAEDLVRVRCSCQRTMADGKIWHWAEEAIRPTKLIFRKYDKPQRSQDSLDDDYTERKIKIETDSCIVIYDMRNILKAMDITRAEVIQNCNLQKNLDGHQWSWRIT